MKHSNVKAHAFKGGAALATAALIAATLIFASCSNGSGSGGTPADSYDAATGKGIVGGVSFTMKSIAAVTNGNVGHADNSSNNNVHTVSLSAYRIGETEVTQELWQAVMGKNPSAFKDNIESGEVQGKRPVENINWYQAIAFCNKLSLKLGLTPCYTVTVAGNPVNFETLAFSAIPTSDNADWNGAVLDMSKTGFRLPTEAEWEWAAKGGTDDKWAGTNEQTQLVNYAWYNANSNKTHEVKKKTANGYGLYDMSGNVAEWCWDWFSTTTPAGGQTDPTGAASGTFRIKRGGDYTDAPANTTRAVRNGDKPENSRGTLGLRLASRP